MRFQVGDLLSNSLFFVSSFLLSKYKEISHFLTFSLMMMMTAQQGRSADPTPNEEYKHERVKTTRRFTNPPHPLDQDQPIELSSCVNFDFILLFFLTELSRLLASTSLPQTLLRSSLPFLLLIYFLTFIPSGLLLFPSRFSNSHRRLSFQRCSTNCQGHNLKFTPKTFAPALLYQLLRTGSLNNTEDIRSSAASPTVMDRFPNSHRRLSFQR